LADVLQDGDVLLTQGAGNIGALAKQLAAQQLQISLLKAGARNEP
jgi:UDP-N-acetylmuramate--alanine ligase